MLLSGVRLLMFLGRVFAVRLGNVFAKLDRYIMFVSSHCKASSVSTQLATTCIVPGSFLEPSTNTINCLCLEWCEANRAKEAFI